jgi:TetR/AcrR family transcriptional regulator
MSEDRREVGLVPLRASTTSSSLPPATLVGMREVPGEMAANLQKASDQLLADFDRVQMHDIAAAAGVARSSLYYYFANKDDVLAYLLRSMLGELTTATAHAVAGPGTPSERLAAVIRAQLEHLDQHPAASQQLIANLGRAGKLPDIAAQVNQGFEVPVRQLLAEGAADGTLRALADEDLGATALFGAVLVIGLRALVVEGHIDVDRVMALIGPMFWHGIAPPSGG